MVLKSKTTNQLFLLALSVLLIDISLLYVNNYGRLLLNQTMLIQFAVSFVFGFFHARKIRTLSKSVDDTNYVLTFIYMSFMYTAWYNVILLNISGLGVLEWILFTIVIFSDSLLAVSKKKSESLSYISSSAMSLMVFGAVMFILKWVIYIVFPDNIYTEYFVGNPTARLLVLVFCIIGLIFLLSSAYKAAKVKLSVQGKTKSALQKGLKKIGKIISDFFKLILTMFSGPGAIIFLFCVVLVFGIVIFAEFAAVGKDILNLIEPILKKLSSTGKAAFVPSVLSFVFQFAVVAAVLIFTFSYEHYLEKLAKDKIHKRLYDNINTSNLPSSEAKQNLYEKKSKEIENQKHFVRILNDAKQLENLTSVK